MKRSPYVQSQIQARSNCFPGAHHPQSDAAPGAYEVTKQLPERNGEFEYQIKSSGEPHARVVRESELSRE